MRFPHPGGPGFGGFADLGTITSDIIDGLFFLICLAVVVGLLFVLVRFLLVATKAAEIYIAKNSPAAPAETPASTSTSTPTTTQRTRAPRTPPST